MRTGVWPEMYRYTHLDNVSARDRWATLARRASGGGSRGGPPGQPSLEWNADTVYRSLRRWVYSRRATARIYDVTWARPSASTTLPTLCVPSLRSIPPPLGFMPYPARGLAVSATPILLGVPQLCRRVASLLCTSRSQRALHSPLCETNLRSVLLCLRRSRRCVLRVEAHRVERS
eukprot:COSAG03_NODE_996_length_5069_cov_7.315091_4_plen_175_part_00